MTSATDSDLKEYYHFAKLALFNVRTLNELQNSNSSEIRALIDKRCDDDKLTKPVNLLHQSTYLQYAYICLVWLWERCNRENITDTIIDGINTDRFDFSKCKILSGPRELNCPAEYLRLIRNAISHGRVKATDEYFEFCDKGRNEENFTSVSLTWACLGQLSNAVFFSVDDYVYKQA